MRGLKHHTVWNSYLPCTGLQWQMTSLLKPRSMLWSGFLRGMPTKKRLSKPPMSSRPGSVLLSRTGYQLLPCSFERNRTSRDQVGTRAGPSHRTSLEFLPGAAQVLRNYGIVSSRQSVRAKDWLIAEKQICNGIWNKKYFLMK